VHAVNKTNSEKDMQPVVKKTVAPIDASSAARLLSMIVEICGTAAAPRNRKAQEFAEIDDTKSNSHVKMQSLAVNSHVVSTYASLKISIPTPISELVNILSFRVRCDKPTVITVSWYS
jgi:hypothetical protein